MLVVMETPNLRRYEGSAEEVLPLGKTSNRRPTACSVFNEKPENKSDVKVFERFFLAGVGNHIEINTFSINIAIPKDRWIDIKILIYDPLTGLRA